MRRLVPLVLIVAVVGSAALAWYSYSQVTVEEPRIASVGVRLTDDSGDLLRAGLDLLAGDVGKAMERASVGLASTIDAEVKNAGFLPVYIPGLTHTIYINDVDSGLAKTPNLGWIGSGETVTASIEVVVVAHQLDESIIEGIVRGGEIDIEAGTQFRLLFVSREARSEVLRFNLLEELLDLLR